MKLTANIIFTVFISFIVVLYGEYTVSLALGVIAATATVSALAIQLLSVAERQAAN